jgi:hypothetical protein
MGFFAVLKFGQIGCSCGSGTGKPTAYGIHDASDLLDVILADASKDG